MELSEAKISVNYVNIVMLRKSHYLTESDLIIASIEEALWII